MNLTNTVQTGDILAQSYHYIYHEQTFEYSKTVNHEKDLYLIPVRIYDSYFPSKLCEGWLSRYQ